MINDRGPLYTDEKNDNDQLTSLSKSSLRNHTTLNQKVYNTLKMAILNHDLPCGTKLNETQVAKQLSVSATPVREAFRMLSAEGLLRTEPWKGVFVQDFSRDEIQEAYQCREVLEPFALELLLQKNNGCLPDHLLQEFRELLERSQSSIDVSEVVQINSHLHGIWINNCGNTKLRQLIDSLNEVLLHERNFSANDELRRRQIDQEHQAMLDSFERGDQHGAIQALRIHIKNGYHYSEERVCD